jgi:hypothetical protein
VERTLSAIKLTLVEHGQLLVNINSHKTSAEPIRTKNLDQLKTFDFPLALIETIRNLEQLISDSDPGKLELVETLYT